MNSLFEGKRNMESGLNQGQNSENISNHGTQLDSLDPNLEEHVATFLHSVGDTLSLCNMSIKNAEDARKAIGVINDLRQRVSEHRRTARALKNLLGSESFAQGAHMVPQSPRILQ